MAKTTIERVVERFSIKKDMGVTIVMSNGVVKEIAIGDATTYNLLSDRAWLRINGDLDRLTALASLIESAVFEARRYIYDPDIVAGLDGDNQRDL